MPITISKLAPAPQYIPESSHASDSDMDSDSDSDSSGGADLEGDLKMGGKRRARRENYNIVTPGEVITDDPQWMRLVFFLKNK
jgi:exosome complex component RRP4